MATMGRRQTKLGAHVHHGPKRHPTWFTAADHDKLSTYVSIRVTGECAAELAEVHPIEAYPSKEFSEVDKVFPADTPVEEVCPFDHTDFGTAGLMKKYRDMTWMLAFTHPTSGVHLAQVFLDPRIRVGESRFGKPPPVHAVHALVDDVSLHHQYEREDGVIPVDQHLHIFRRYPLRPRS